MNSKQRAYLRGLANGIEPIVHMGKGGVSAELIKQADDALTARELIKGRVLETAPLTAKEAAVAVADAVKAEVVCVTGRTYVLFRRNPEAPVIEGGIPKDKKTGKSL